MSPKTPSSLTDEELKQEYNKMINFADEKILPHVKKFGINNEKLKKA